MKRFIILCAFAFCALQGFGQSTWQRIYGFNSFSLLDDICINPDSGFTIACEAGAPNAPFSLVKFSADGQVQWAHAINNSYGQWGVRRIIKNANNGYYTSGTTSGRDNDAVYLMKLNSNGDFLSEKLYTAGTPWIEDNNYPAVRRRADGELILVYESDWNLRYHYLFNKIDSTGNIIAAKAFSSTPVSGAKVRDVEITSDNGFLAIGALFASGNNFFVKTDSNLNLMWAKKILTLPSGGFNPTSIINTLDGNSMVGGVYYYGSSNQYCPILIKISLDGTVLWAKAYPNITGLTASISQDIDGSITNSGEMQDSSGSYFPFLMKTDSTGIVKWTKEYTANWIIAGDIDNFRTPLHRKTVDGYLVAALNYDIRQTTSNGLYIIKTDTAGNSGCFEKPLFVFDSAIAVSSTLSAIDTLAGISQDTIATMLTFQFPISPDCYSILSAKELQPSPSFQIYPNPSQGHFTLVREKAEGYGMIEVFSAMGQRVYSRHLTHAAKEEIVLSGCSAGIYLVRLTDGEHAYSQRVVVE